MTFPSDVYSIDRGESAVSKTFLLLVAGIGWLVAIVSNTVTISHAQEPAATLRLPFQGRATVNESPGAFSIVNPGAFVAIRAEGGIAGLLALGTQYGLVGKGNDLGLYGEGLDFGVGGKSVGLAGVIGKVDREAAENVMGEDGTTVAVKKGDPHSQTFGYLGSHEQGVTGVAFTGAKAAVYGKWVKEAGKNANAAFLTTGVTHGYLGTAVNGVQGEYETPNGFGVAGKAENGANAAGIYGQSDKGFAGFFRGKVTITERLYVKRIDAVEIYAKGGLVGQNAGKFFKIDHPVDPENKYLVHASVESSEYKNFYDGIAIVGADGTVSVTLPDWFAALSTLR